MFGREKTIKELQQEITGLKQKQALVNKKKKLESEYMKLKYGPIMSFGKVMSKGASQFAKQSRKSPMFKNIGGF